MSNDKTAWHQIFAAVQQEHLATVNIAVETETPLTSQPPRSDLLIMQPVGQTGWTELQRQYLPDGLRDSVGQHNLLELKYTESVNQDVFDQVLGYHFFYRETRHLSREQVKCFILSSHTTELATREKFGYFRQSASGVYHSNNVLLTEIPLILLNELSPQPYNGFFKLFGSQQRARLEAAQTIKTHWLPQSSKRLFHLLHGLFKRWFTRQEVVMEDILTLERLIEEGKSWEEVALWLTPDNILMELLQDTPLLQQIENRAMEQGLEKGLEKGLEQGLVQGLEKGLEQGLEKGLVQGLEKGLEQGLEKGLEQGLEKGLEQGRRDALLQTLRRVLVLQFNVALDRFDKELVQLTLPQLEQISDAAFETKDLAQFEAILTHVIHAK